MREKPASIGVLGQGSRYQQHLQELFDLEIPHNFDVIGNLFLNQDAAS